MKKIKVDLRRVFRPRRKLALLAALEESLLSSREHIAGRLFWRSFPLSRLSEDLAAEAREVARLALVGEKLDALLLLRHVAALRGMSFELLDRALPDGLTAQLVAQRWDEFFRSPGMQSFLRSKIAQVGQRRKRATLPVLLRARARIIESREFQVHKYAEDTAGVFPIIASTPFRDLLLEVQTAFMLVDREPQLELSPGYGIKFTLKGVPENLWTTLSTGSEFILELTPVFADANLLH